LSIVDDAVAAIAAGNIVVMPTDTVYGIVATAHSEPAVHRLYAAKGRSGVQPTALVGASVDVVVDAIPGLQRREVAVLQSLLPGAYTVVMANPTRSFAWLCGATPEAIGVRVPVLTGAAKEILERTGLLVATSANLAGGPDVRRVSDLAPDIVAASACIVDGGELPGLPSTVVDVAGDAPKVLRAGAGDVDRALARIAAALSE
jgi:L-threonylcarbamoyladenylate synthase